MAKSSDGDWIVPAIVGGLAAVLLVMAGVFAYVQWRISSRVDAVAAWPTTEATVVVNEMKMVDGINRNSGKWDKVPQLTLEYTYEVGGRSYTGKNVNVEGTGGPFAHEDYPAGSRMPVRYDPADPSIAGVKTDLTHMSLGGFTYACAGLTLVGLALAALAVRSWLRMRRASATA